MSPTSGCLIALFRIVTKEKEGERRRERRRERVIVVDMVLDCVRMSVMRKNMRFGFW